MNSQEAQRKFAEKSNIRNSEFDRQNTNQTRNAVSTSQGSIFLPKDNVTPQSKVLSRELVAVLVAAVIGVMTFFLVNLLMKNMAPIFYQGLLFLGLNLLVSFALAYFSYRQIKKISYK
ncbi:putative membrane protein [Enterococcus sp. PF1-24]|uniref:hypothetical protein n=1 Tax=unclassified Enterococcus TaxID=2608891 RepID=UPI002476FCBD|nr:MULTISPECIES: hypothetical protein [unclassified Enterococcus]MDH6364962.1 putative membrane protein [Enterococcus sp. PFB1-1]MDH6402063.1 putative membrane protein [Enterococcus sp. PF1-24]